jgi:hypothetical protein
VAVAVALCDASSQNGDFGQDAGLGSERRDECDGILMETTIETNLMDEHRKGDRESNISLLDRSHTAATLPHIATLEIKKNL